MSLIRIVGSWLLAFVVLTAIISSSRRTLFADVPVDMTSQNAALDFLAKRANGLRIPDPRSGRLREANWSFDAKFYAIQ